MHDPFSAIDTARLRLRCVRPEDAEATAALMTAEVSRWLARWPLPFTAAMASARITASRTGAYSGTVLPFAVIEKASAALTGWLVVQREANDTRRGSVGFWLGEAFHSRGYMREAAPAAIEAAFRLLELHTIEAGCQPENAGSLAVLRACGMVPIGSRMVPAPARGRDELCHMFELRRPAHHGNTAFPLPGAKG